MKNDDLHEILDILIEECSEVIQAASKIKRFGEGDMNPNDKDYPNGDNNAKKLLTELADLTAMISLVFVSIDDFHDDELYSNIRAKLTKLKKWSNIKHVVLDEVIEIYVD